MPPPRSCCSPNPNPNPNPNPSPNPNPNPNPNANPAPNQVVMQRTQRGRAARAAVARLAAAQGAAVAAFLARHPSFSAAPERQALVLPRLASGVRLGAGAFGCVYRPEAAWHFPRDGIAIKAAPLRGKQQGL